jgi:hypothetical protein
MNEVIKLFSNFMKNYYDVMNMVLGHKANDHNDVVNEIFFL